MTGRGFACALALCAAPALADDCEVLGALEDMATGAAAPVGATCTTYLTEAGKEGISCHWPFAFRDSQALAFADAIWSAAPACQPGTALIEKNDVNHPDSYALRQWQAQAATYAISVKDKGGLNKTFVFVRREPN